MAVKSTSTLILFCFSLVACTHNYSTDVLTPALRSIVQDSVQRMAESIAKNISDKGVVEWLQYFEHSPDFFMASDGQLVFPNNDSASRFINNTLVKTITKIELHWSNIRVDALTLKLAGMAANFHEDITGTDGKTIPADGYFTAIAEQTAEGWKLRNAHWSIRSTTSK